MVSFFSIFKKKQQPKSKIYGDCYGFPCQDCLECDGPRCLGWGEQWESRSEIQMWCHMEALYACFYFRTDPRGRRRECSECGWDGLKKGKILDYGRHVGICSICEGKGWVWEQADEKKLVR